MNIGTTIIILSIISISSLLLNIISFRKGSVLPHNVFSIRKNILKPNSKLHRLFWNKNHDESKPQHTFLNAIFLLFFYMHIICCFIFILAWIILKFKNIDLFVLVTIFVTYFIFFEIIDIILISINRYIYRKYDKINIFAKNNERENAKKYIEKMYPGYFDDALNHLKKKK